MAKVDNEIKRAVRVSEPPVVFRPCYEAVLKWATGPVEPREISAAPRPEEFVRGRSRLPSRHQQSDDCLVWSDLEGLPEMAYRQLQGHRFIHD